MTDEELHAKIMSRLVLFARGGFNRQVDRKEADALRAYLEQRHTALHAASFSWPGFVGFSLAHLPEQIKFMRMPKAQLTALAKMSGEGSQVWLQCRAAQLYWRMCWLASQEKKP